MTPEQKIKWAIYVKTYEEEGQVIKEVVSSSNIEDRYENYANPDIAYEFRGGEVETGLKSPHCRHYESKEVAAEMPDGSWVGWTYWYGGGKHGEPEAMDWMSKAYELDLKEEEKLVVVSTWSKK